MSANSHEGPTSLRFRWILAVILFGGLLLRAGYLVVQAAHDPWFAQPAFDGALYVDWARTLAAAGEGSGGAFYLAPLYPWVLSWWIRLAGESFGLLYGMQQALGLATAALIAVAGRRRLGESGALAAAALYLLYWPLQYFASRPLGESLAIFLLFAALAAAWREDRRGAALAGLLVGLAALARPNLLLVAVFWIVGEAAARRWRRAVLVLAGSTLALLPAVVHNLGASGHFVPVSSNGGLTLYHGNGPGARGVYTPATGLSGDPLRQREEATALARLRSGLDLDPVEADRWWGRQALRARLERPAETPLLVGRRLLLTLDSHEYALDYAPELDTNPWRPVLDFGQRLRVPLVPLGLLLGLGATGLILGGARRSGGWRVWAAIGATALAPLLFYVSSRYRLPLAALLVLPAGAGLAALFRPGEEIRRRRGKAALAAGLVLCLLSLLMPFPELKRSMTGQALAGRAVAHRKAGNPERARGDARRALELAPRSATVQFNAGTIAEALGQPAEAEASYRRALAIRGDLAEAAGNLAAILIRSGRAAEAIAPLRRALRERPWSDQCWNNLIVALFEAGRREQALEAAQEALRYGVTPDPGLIERIRAFSDRDLSERGQSEGESQ